MMATPAPESQLWADKYRPRRVSEMCGPAMAQKLKQWLEKFPVEYRNPEFKRAVLLSGPPGVGKTTTAHLVAAELGYQVREFNASNLRSAKSLAESISDIVDNRSMSGVGFGRSGGDPNDRHLHLDKFVLLMDEVDGCDRGGVGEICSMIKNTKVPILCTCNDRWNQKLRSLMNYVEDLKFSRIPYNVIAGYIRTRVLAPEGCTVPHALLQDFVKLEGNDIRSVLNNLQLWCRTNRSMSNQEVIDAARRSLKNEDIGLFGAAEAFLLQGSSANAGAPRKTIEELQSMFYSEDLVDLFVQENYLHFKPDKGEWMTAVASAAASISRGDVVKRFVFTEQNWSVSSYNVLSSAIVPCAVTRGHYQTFLSGPAAGFDKSRPVKFPQWLGHNSTAGKNLRLASGLARQAQHPLHGLLGSAEDFIMDYSPTLAAALTWPLSVNGKDGIPQTISTLDTYRMTRDDWQWVQDVTTYKKMTTASHQSGVTATNIAAPVKAALTRAYNATHKADRQSIRSRLGILPTADNDNDDGAENVEYGDNAEEASDAETATKKHRKESPAEGQPTKKKAPPAKPSAKRGGSKKAHEG